jgi:hypothetical protein
VMGFKHSDIQRYFVVTDITKAEYERMDERILAALIIWRSHCIVTEIIHHISCSRVKKGGLEFAQGLSE